MPMRRACLGDGFGLCRGRALIFVTTGINPTSVKIAKGAIIGVMVVAVCGYSPPASADSGSQMSRLRQSMPSAALYISRIASSSAMSSRSRLRRAMTFFITFVS